MKTKLFIIGLFISICCFGQSKIGNITMSDSIIKLYLFDCYNHPNIVSFEHNYDFNTNKCFDCPYHEDEMKNESIVAQKSAYLKKSIISIIIERIDTTTVNWQYPEVIIKTFKKNGETWYIVKHPKWKIVRIDYYIPRETSENDFIKWFVKQNKHK
jgi:hypothetical protein